MLKAVNDRQDLNKDNVIDAIKDALQHRPKVKDASPHKVYSNERIESQEYSKWEKTSFDINHLFEAQKFTEPKCNQLTLLHLVADFDFKNVANALLRIEGINVDVVNENGHTPLHLAAYFGHEEMVNILIKNGANPLSKDNNGNTPKNFAKDNTKKLLKEAEEKQLKQQALNKSISAGGATAVLGTAAAVALFVTGTVAVELISIVIAVAAIAAAALAVGGITYMMLKPSTKIDEVEKEQGIIGDERKA